MDGKVTNSLSPTSMLPSIVARLDRLDSTINFLEGKKDGSRWAGDGGVELVERERIPLDVAVKEAQTKGSIMDRITALEDRLVQLLLDNNESEGACPSQSTSEIEQNSPSITSSPRGSLRKGFSQSFSRFRSSSHANKQPSQTCVDKFEVKDRRDQQQQKSRQIDGSLVGKKSGKVDERSLRKPRKRAPSSWLNLHLLGC